MGLKRDGTEANGEHKQKERQRKSEPQMRKNEPNRKRNAKQGQKEGGTEAKETEGR